MTTKTKTDNQKIVALAEKLNLARAEAQTLRGEINQARILAASASTEVARADRAESLLAERAEEVKAVRAQAKQIAEQRDVLAARLREVTPLLLALHGVTPLRIKPLTVVKIDALTPGSEGRLPVAS